MTIVKHELRQGKLAFIIWTLAITVFMVICVFMFPEMKSEMKLVGNLFASMGSFTAAFGMDRLNFGTLIGFYAIECGNILGLGGAFFASMIGAGILAKEEKDHSAEFLLTHPVSRNRVVTEKLIAVMLQIAVMNIIIFAFSVVSIVLIGEAVPWKELVLMHAAFAIMHIEIAGICFGISAFIRRASAGIGLGLAAMLYFMNLIANMSDQAAFLKYITPFGYCDGADIVSNGTLDPVYVGIGMALMIIGIAAAYLHYAKKDIH